ncbi:RNA polymerase sigma factor [Neorhodopirellula pilleata]|uniref:RNA polymerase sigma factor SigD n=1 Tax=Neorhodopirellula pilleata TaxID=2714738 RepID=A0A5C6ADK0_9BACT|nr:sigma-70 family RNA polymerase sigma factor [Neorhodopirellula pilleata]TWT96323.1 RNA polymerase sigma factor SigD [Neorhodopirellula pilleata]
MASQDLSKSKSRWSTSIGLLDGLKEGDETGWSKFVHLYTPLVVAWCRKLGVHDADIADVCQEVFRGVHSGIAKFCYEGSHATFRGWLWVITRRAVGRCIEHSLRQPSALGGTDAAMMISQLPDWINDDAIPENPLAESLVLSRAAELIRDDFEEHTWRAFWMTAVEDRKACDIAAELGMTEGAVRQAKFRVLARLKEFLGN